MIFGSYAWRKPPGKRILICNRKTNYQQLILSDLLTISKDAINFTDFDVVQGKNCQKISQTAHNLIGWNPKPYSWVHPLETLATNYS